MVSFYLFIYIFLSQFPSIVNIGSSYIGLHILILPIFYFFIPKIKLIINYILPIFLLSFLIGFLKYFQFNFQEIILRLVGLVTVISAIILPIILYHNSKNIILFKKNYIKPIIYLSIPNLVFCLFEVIFRISKSDLLFSILIQSKDLIFVPNRSTQTIGSISGLFPEHGLFAPFLLFILGLSFWLINKSSINYCFFISVLWILIATLHSSGLFYASLILSILIFVFLLIISTISNLRISKKSFKIFTLLLIVSGVIFAVGRYTHEFLFVRFADIFNNFDIMIIATLDKSLGYKLLPFFTFFKTSLFELLIGSGSSFYSQLVISKANLLPNFLFDNDYFMQNFISGRFALNSTLICSILELGFIFWISIILLLRKYIRLFNPIELFINYSNILRYRFNLLELISFTFFMASFLSIFGAVPLAYPFPFLSLSMMFIIFEHKKNNYIT